MANSLYPTYTKQQQFPLLLALLPCHKKKRIALLNSITEANNEVVCVMRTLVVMWKVIMSHLFLYGEASFLLIILFYFPGSNSFINSVLSHSLTNTAPKLLFIHLNLLLVNVKTYYSCFFYLHVILKIHLNVFLAAYGSSLYSTLPRDG